MPVKIATHSGSFHADDVLGVAVLMRLFPDAEIVRTRDAVIISSSDFVVDVGDEYVPMKKRYDHHQKGFSKFRENGVKFAGAGLVWCHHGIDYIMDVLADLSPEQAVAVHSMVDARLISLADAIDNGQSSVQMGDFSLSGIVSNMNPTWLDFELDQDAAFLNAVKIAEIILANQVRNMASEVLAADVVRRAEVLNDGKVLLLSVPSVPFVETVCREMPDVRLVVYPESTGHRWQVRTVPVEPMSFTARMDLPASWAGLRDKELSAVSGVEDAVFCHVGRFIAGAESRHGALALAETALGNH